MSNPDLTELIEISQNAGFMNNKIYTGTLTLSGSWVPGYSTQLFTVPLDKVPDLLAAMFNGPTDTVFGSDPRPSSAWFKRGVVWVLGDNIPAGYNGYPVPYKISIAISGQNAIIKASTISQISPTLTLRSTNFSYRIVDYSVF